MTTEQMFKMGVTPVEGALAGKRFRVLSIDADKMSVQNWDDDGERMTMKHGAYKIWEEPKTIFEDCDKVVTLGALKEAAEKKGLPDDTRIMVPSLFYGVAGASIRLVEVNGKRAILID